MTCHKAQRRSGFTLVELLTVVGIIALLIGILLPSIAGARKQAKKASVQAQISAIDKGLQMFHNDFNQYPDSGTWTRKTSTTYIEREDPITPVPSQPTDAPGKIQLTGAHWLARAMAGPDLQGVDTQGYSLKSKAELNYVSGTPTTISVDQTYGGTGVPMNEYQKAQLDRKGVYLENSSKQMRPDTDFGFNQENAPRMGRQLIFDVFGGPILYYRANNRAKLAFTNDHTKSAVYNWEDNVKITGKNGPTSTDLAAPDNTAWIFAAGVPNHIIGRFDVDSLGTTYDTADVDKPKSFINYLHDHAVDQATGGASIRPLNPDTYILLSAGFDGQFGTDDDVANFKLGGL